MDDIYDVPDRKPYVLTLPRPVEVDGGTMFSLTLREPTVHEVLVAERHLTQQTIPAQRAYQNELLRAVTGISQAASDALPISAATRAAQYLQAFVDMDLEPIPADERTDTLLITLAQPTRANGLEYEQLMLSEPTLEQIAEAESQLKDTKPYAVRLYQICIVSKASGVPEMAIRNMPVSVINRAAVFVQGFADAAPEITVS